MKPEEEPERLSPEWHARDCEISAHHFDRGQMTWTDPPVVRDRAAKLRSIPGLEARVAELEEFVAELADCRDRNRLMRLQEQAEQMTKEKTDEE